MRIIVCEIPLGEGAKPYLFQGLIEVKPLEVKPLNNSQTVTEQRTNVDVDVIGSLRAFRDGCTMCCRGQQVLLGST